MSQKRKDKQARRTARKRAARNRPRVERDHQGRAHLVVHRDAGGRTLGLTLAAPVFKERWQNEIATGAANTAHAASVPAVSQRGIEALGNNMMQATSKMVDAALARARDQPIACGAGCAHCCYQAVGVVAPEVFAIYAWIQANREEAELRALHERVRELDDETRGLGIDQRFSPRLPCVFLENQRCSIYEVRPLACRAKHSLDERACERSLKEPSARQQFLAGELPIPCFPDPVRIMNAVTAGVQLALDELHHLEMAPLELTAALRLLLEDPQRLTQQWLAGEQPFYPARGADVTHDRHMRELVGTRD